MNNKSAIFSMVLLITLLILWIYYFNSDNSNSVKSEEEIKKKIERDRLEEIKKHCKNNYSGDYKYKDGVCSVVKCNDGYFESDGSCILKERRECNKNNPTGIYYYIDGECKLIHCKYSNYVKDGNKCVCADGYIESDGNCILKIAPIGEPPREEPPMEEPPM